ncbi:MAG: HNH endonuclease signature motif containing protein [bacterium]
MNKTMELKKKNALKLWDERYPGMDKVTDFSGRVMTKGQYAVTNSKSGWNIDHRQPQSNGGTNHKNNLELVNWKTNQEKADKITFSTNGKKYQVIKDSNNTDGYSYVISEVKSKSTNVVSNDLIAKEEFFNFFDKTIVDNKDFSGEIVIKDFYKKDSPFGWDIGYYTENKKDINNCYIANLKTLKSCSGKTSFKLSGQNYKLKKINNEFKFVNEDSFNSLLDFSSIMTNINKTMNNDNTIFYDFLNIKLCCKKYNFSYSKDAVKLLEIINKVCHASKLIYNVIEKDSYGYNYELSIRFNTPTYEDTIKVNQVSMLLNNIQKFIEEDVSSIFVHHVTLTDKYSNVDKSILRKMSEIKCSNVNINTNATITMSEDVYKILTEQGKYDKNSFKMHRTYYDTYFERSYSFTNFRDTMKYFK